MSVRSAIRWFVVCLIVAGGIGFIAAHPEAARGYYLEIYPTDPAKKQALELCFLQDHKFNRLDADQRENCYKHALVPAQSMASQMAVDPPAANEVDLRRAAASGHMPKNDIRRLEQNETAQRERQ